MFHSFLSFWMMIITKQSLELLMKIKCVKIIYIDCFVTVIKKQITHHLLKKDDFSWDYVGINLSWPYKKLHCKGNQIRFNEILHYKKTDRHPVTLLLWFLLNIRYLPNKVYRNGDTAIIMIGVQSIYFVKQVGEKFVASL